MLALSYLLSDNDLLSRFEQIWERAGIELKGSMKKWEVEEAARKTQEEKQ